MSPTLKQLYGFDGTDGGDPTGALLIAGDGSLVGTASMGGPGFGDGGQGDGIVFQIPPTATGYGPLVTLAAFTGTDGSGPMSGLTQDAAGDLFGTTAYGGAVGSEGTVFEIPRTMSGYGGLATVASFTGSNGDEPSSGLLIDAAGDLFGTTSLGGATLGEEGQGAGSGTVFEIAKTTTGYSSPTLLVSFAGYNGAGPDGGLATDSAGDLFGTTAEGTVFEIPRTATGFGPLQGLGSFETSNGSNPVGKLIVDAAGDLFGTTREGGAYGQANGGQGGGTVFEIAKTATGYGGVTTLAAFDGSDGKFPDSGLLMDAVGNLFGTTNQGGPNEDGTVFEIARTSTGYGDVRMILAFDGANGSLPIGDLTADAAGNLFGTTENGGPADDGTVFEITDSGFGTSTACYCRGTLIQTAEKARAVESLAIGDHLTTALGRHRPIRWIGTRSYAGRFANGNPDILPICFKPGSLGDNIPRRDLWVSPKHAMFLGGLLIPAEQLVNGVSIVQAECIESVEYFHIELDSHDVIIAEGALSETFVDDDSRAMFHNAHEFAARYPDADPVEARFCAPRAEEGYQLDAIRAELDARAGITTPPSTPATPLRGTLDRADAEGIEGWAQNPDEPEGEVCLDVFVDGLLRTRTIADRYRDDLRAAGIGSGAHSFRLMWDEPLPPRQDHIVEVRRTSDGATLWCSPRCVPAARAAAA